MELAEKRSSRKTRVGVVVTDKMQKSRVVACERRVPHGEYGKIVRRTLRVMVHDEEDASHRGDTVEIMETRPLSKLKRWRLIRVIEKAK
jgi:small subunit ribosomal protein S17